MRLTIVILTLILGIPNAVAAVYGYRKLENSKIEIFTIHGSTAGNSKIIECLSVDPIDSIYVAPGLKFYALVTTSKTRAQTLQYVGGGQSKSRSASVPADHSVIDIMPSPHGFYALLMSTHGLVQEWSLNGEVWSLIDAPEKFTNIQKFTLFRYPRIVKQVWTKLKPDAKIFLAEQAGPLEYDTVFGYGRSGTSLASYNTTDGGYLIRDDDIGQSGRGFRYVLAGRKTKIVIQDYVEALCNEGDYAYIEQRHGVDVFSNSGRLIHTFKGVHLCVTMD
ncbi:MAG: hypothetical protein K8R88_06110 [Armatimonadetes bacterium]|nr:hypothetical protein [Armatimonadota bacterium]